MPTYNPALVREQYARLLVRLREMQEENGGPSNPQADGLDAAVVAAAMIVLASAGTSAMACVSAATQVLSASGVELPARVSISVEPLQ